MFDRVFVHGDAVVALPRPGTKTVGPVAFDLGGQEIDMARQCASPELADGDRVRLEYRSSRVGQGPSQLWLLAASSSEPLHTIELPDAISVAVEAPFGWYVGCQDGFLYALERSGELRWRWQTPGAAAFRPAGPGDVYSRPCPYRLAANGRSALVGWFGSIWSVAPDGHTEWGLRLQDLVPASVIEVRLHGRDGAAAERLGVAADASREQIRRAYLRAVKRTHPDLHPDDARAAERFRRVDEAYKALTGEGAGSNGDGTVIRFCFPSLAPAFFLGVVEEDWLVGSGAGRLFRLSRQGRLLAHVQLSSGSVFPVRDCCGAIVAFCSYPGHNDPEPNLWFVDAPAPVRLQYPPDWLLGSYGSLLLGHQPRSAYLALFDESGQLVVHVRCPRPISSVCVANGTLLLAAGALICLDIDGLSPPQRTRVWRPPFTRAASHERTVAERPTVG
jgi:hypothetical protein